MSLINEALKRTRDAAYQPGHTPPAVPPVYDDQAGVKPTSSKGPLLITLTVAVVALVGVVILGKGIASRIHALSNGLTGSEQVTEKRAPQPPSPPPVAEPKVSEEEIISRVMEKLKTEQVSTAEVPKLLLQGITYTPGNSDAMINGVTIREGEDIEGAHVVAIESRRVKLDFHGREFVLRLP